MKHITFEQRNVIEHLLNKKYSFSNIAKTIMKNRTTIAREVKARRYIYNNMNRSNLNLDCPKLKKYPYVCNGCHKRRTCRKIKFLYHSKKAEDSYKNKLSYSRQGIDLSDEDRHNIDSLLKDLLLNKKQSINHIIINNPNIITCSKPTLYSYINQGVFSICNIDLPRKVKYKPRKKSVHTRKRRNLAILNGRTIKDFYEYLDKNPDASIVEMDTVEGVKGGKVFLTLCFRKSKLMLIFLLDSKTIDCVVRIFDYIKSIIDLKTYKRLFEVILTDNGSEFLDPTSIESCINTGEVLSHLFYCDPNCSWQKGTIEKNHEFIRYVLPKGSSFDHLKQHNVDSLASNINNISREILENKTPYEIFSFHYGAHTLDKFNISFIEENEVNLSKQSIK